MIVLFLYTTSIYMDPSITLDSNLKELPSHANTHFICSVYLGTNYSYWRTNVLARYDKKYLISSGFFTSILVPHVTTDRKKSLLNLKKKQSTMVEMKTVPVKHGMF